jgi:hypothetical protein
MPTRPRCGSTTACSRVPNPGAGDRDFLPTSTRFAKRIIRAQLEPALRKAAARHSFQFERHGYFVADRIDSPRRKPVFNRWAKAPCPLTHKNPKEEHPWNSCTSA